MAKAKQASFEENMLRIEKIVADLDHEALPLDEAMKLYEEGVGLIRHCQKFLTEAEQRITVIQGEGT